MRRFGHRRTVARFAAVTDEKIAADEKRRSHRQFSERHAQLLSELEADESDRWSARALHACLETLRTSTLTEAWAVDVVDAWTETDDAFCVTYRADHAGHSLVGLRRARKDALAHYEFDYERAVREGDSRTVGMFVDVGMYDLGDDPLHPDPSAFGSTVAEFDIGEPLGTIHNVLRRDSHGTAWWGSVEDDLPTRP